MNRRMIKKKLILIFVSLLLIVPVLAIDHEFFIPIDGDDELYILEELGDNELGIFFPSFFEESYSGGGYDIDPLFDIFVIIPWNKKFIEVNELSMAKIRIINKGEIVKLDAFMKYWIVNENNELIYEKRETISVTKELEWVHEFILPSDTKKGLYKFYAEIKYDDGKIALAGDSFEVVESTFEKYSNMAKEYYKIAKENLVWIIIGLVALFFFFLILTGDNDEE